LVLALLGGKSRSELTSARAAPSKSVAGSRRRSLVESALQLGWTNHREPHTWLGFRREALPAPCRLPLSANDPLDDGDRRCYLARAEDWGQTQSSLALLGSHVWSRRSFGSRTAGSAVKLCRRERIGDALAAPPPLSMPGGQRIRQCRRRTADAVMPEIVQTEAAAVLVVGVGDPPRPRGERNED
jgi:hypothetical protein